MVERLHELRRKSAKTKALKAIEKLSEKFIEDSPLHKILAINELKEQKQAFINLLKEIKTYEKRKEAYDKLTPKEQDEMIRWKTREVPHHPVYYRNQSMVDLHQDYVDKYKEELKHHKTGYAKYSKLKEDPSNMANFHKNQIKEIKTKLKKSKDVVKQFRDALKQDKKYFKELYKFFKD